jgi:phage terminase large subunit-like protein
MRTYSTDELRQLHPTTRYAAAIAQNIYTPSCLRERQACERHLKDLERQGSEKFPFVFDESRANRIFDWFEKCCRHVRGPLSGELIQLLPFQHFDLGSMFGWVHKDTGQRRFKRSFNERARGNVKSTEMSGIALYGMCSDCIYPPAHPEMRRYEESPEIECAAVDKEQAKRVWGDAKKMGEKSPDISKRLIIRRTYIEHRDRGGWLRYLSKETKNKDSGAPCIVIIDEYHAHTTSEIVDTLYSGFGKRWQSLMPIITTAGVDAENNPAYKEYDICCKILAGDITDEHYFVMIRELDEGDDPHDKKLWVKANPVLRVDNEYSRILLGEIEDEYNKAYGSGDPDKIREFLVKRCDRWQADAENKYFSGVMNKWKAAAIPRNEFLNLVRGRPCYNGDDLSKHIDLTATGFVFRLDDGCYAVTAHGFIPENAVIRHEHSDRVPYRVWAKDGWCTLTPGDVTDDDYIMAYIQAQITAESWELIELCYDPYGARSFASNCAKMGIVDEDQLVEIRQGVQTLSEPTKKFRELVLQDRIVHDGSPLLTWCLENAVEIVDSNGNIKLSKKHKNDSQRIDLAAAIINAFVRALLDEGALSVEDLSGDDVLGKLWG